MARRYSESSTDSWSLVERRSSVESSDDEDEGEIVVARDVYEEYDGESVGHDSMEDDTDFSESELEDEDAVEQEQEVSEEEAEEEDGEVETILEEEALADSAARHFVAAEKVVERLDELADSCDSPMEEALFSAVATPERMRLFLLLTLAITGAIVLGLERSLAANLNLITPQGTSESAQAGLPSREHLSRIGVAEVREFLNRRQLMRTPPRFTESFSAYQKAYLKRVGEMQLGGRVQGCTAGWANTSISVRTPSSFWSQAQCKREDAPKLEMRRFVWEVKPFIHYLPVRINSTPFNESLSMSPLYNPAPTNVIKIADTNNLFGCPGIKQSSNTTTVQQPQQQPKTLQQVLLPSRKPLQQLQPVRPNQLLMVKQVTPCKPSATRPCKPAVAPRPTKAPRTVRPTKTQPLKPTTVVKPVVKPTSPKSPSLAVYRNYSVARVYHDRSLRRDAKPCFLPSKSVFPTKKVVEKKKEESTVCKNTVLERMKKRREQQNVAARKMNKRSAPPPVIYANASTHSHSKALMRKTSFAAGHCDRRTVKDFRPLPCISYKERLPCLAPPPRRLLTATPAKKKASGSSKNWANESKKTRSPKKEYIRRIPLV